MKIFLCPGLLISAALFLAVPAFAQGATKPDESAPKVGKLVAVTEKDEAWAAKARKEYPLRVCVTSKEGLGEMGDAVDYIYRAEGQADRLVRFCCEGCSDDFMLDPAAHLAVIDAAKKADGGTKSEKPESGAQR